MKKNFSVILLSLALAFALAAGISTAAIIQGERYKARLQEIYDGAILAALRQMEDMELAINKSILSSDQAAHQYLSQVSSGAAQVQRSLSLLPLSHTATQSAVKFANQLSDYTLALLRGESYSERDLEQLNALISALEESTAALYAARDALSYQAASGETAFYPTEENTQAYDSAVSYPTLIYDGPFSDARETGTPKALGLREITREEAHQAAMDFVGADRVLSVSQGADMGGVIPCYGVTLQLKDITLEAAVTRQGGKILWLAPDTANFSQEKSVEECREAALSFLSSRGYENMQSTYFQVYQGVAVISFAATQGQTLLYPDLIKVQLRMDTAQVVGIEAKNYLMNHTARGVLSPSITLEEAQGAVSDRLTIEESRLCLIPDDGSEKLCYEFKGIHNGHIYLVYISAETGKQEEILKVVETSTGLETA
ncbi:MAG: hypothetical protein E7329_00085 [Clostridiales bacterium]|nr:hypothetical protein [Clostridiales bacterium]